MLYLLCLIFWQKILQLSIFTLSLYFKYLLQMSEIFDVASIYDYYRENMLWHSLMMFSVKMMRHNYGLLNRIHRWCIKTIYLNFNDHFKLIETLPDLMELIR